MSNYLGVGGVSQTLKTLLEDRMAYGDPVLPAEEQVQVTISPPDATHSTSRPRLNLFLYHVTENPYLKNQEVPTQAVRGAYGAPPLALNLHYLLTAYGRSATSDLEAHQVLGDALRVLHDTPVIDPGLLQTRDAEPHQPVLDSNLQEEFEQIRIYLEPVGLEELSKVWTALNTPYRLSVAYQVSVVQIESQRGRRYPLPVRERRVFGVPFRHPQIAGVSPLLAAVGGTLTISGANFSGGDVRVRLGGVEVPVTPAVATEIHLAVPDDPLLQPGPQPVDVVVGAGVAELPQAGFVSNRAVFMLVPQVTGVSPLSGAAGTTVTITGTRLYRSGGATTVLLGDQPLAPAGTDPTSLQVSTSGLAPGTYRVRVRVDGAESLEDSFTFTVA